jgi:hypothetical protein
VTARCPSLAAISRNDGEAIVDLRHARRRPRHSFRFLALVPRVYMPAEHRARRASSAPRRRRLRGNDRRGDLVRCVYLMWQGRDGVDNPVLEHRWYPLDQIVHRLTSQPPRESLGEHEAPRHVSRDLAQNAWAFSPARHITAQSAASLIGSREVMSCRSGSYSWRF